MPVGWIERVERKLHPYFSTKAEIESDMIAAARSGVPVCVVSPTACHGPYDLKRIEICILWQLANGTLPFVATHMLNVVDVRDVAVATVRLVEAERFGEVVPVSGHNVTTDVMVDRVCSLTGAFTATHAVADRAGFRARTRRRDVVCRRRPERALPLSRSFHAALVPVAAPGSRSA